MLFAKFATTFSITAGTRCFYKSPSSFYGNRKNQEKLPVTKSYYRFAHDSSFKSGENLRNPKFSNSSCLSDFLSRRKPRHCSVYDGILRYRNYGNTKDDKGSGSRVPGDSSTKPSRQPTVIRQPSKGTPSGGKPPKGKTSGGKSPTKATIKKPSKPGKIQKSGKKKMKVKKRCSCGSGKKSHNAKPKTSKSKDQHVFGGKQIQESGKGSKHKKPEEGYDFLINSESALKKSDKTSVAIIGSGNWGTAIAKLVGENTKKLKDFNQRVNMWVHPEQIDGKNLTDIINQTHENVKYLKGIKLPENVFAVSDVGETVKNSQILVFVLPHQFIPKVCESMKGKIKKDATAVSLIKGFGVKKDGGLELITRIVENHLNIPCSSLIGANIALGVAMGEFSESTLSCRDPRYAMKLHQIFQTDFFRISVVHKSDGVEICGALKNIVAIAVGFCDGMKLGNNTKAAVIRLGLMEMVRFIDEFFPGTDISVYFESCGVADLITTCFGGRNRRVSEAFVTKKKSFEELEKEMLNGQKLQGPLTADEVNQFLKSKNAEQKYPLFTAVHYISTGKLKPPDMIKSITKHPEHERSMQVYLKASGASRKK